MDALTDETITDAIIGVMVQQSGFWKGNLETLLIWMENEGWYDEELVERLYANYEATRQPTFTERLLQRANSEVSMDIQDIPMSNQKIVELGKALAKIIEDQPEFCAQILFSTIQLMQEHGWHDEFLLEELEKLYDKAKPRIR